MHMFTETQARELMGATMYDQSGTKIGKIGQIFLDDETGVPEFATVQTGMFGSKETFVPLAEADFSGDRVVVPYAKDQIKGAPSIDHDGHLSQDEEATLYGHYGLGYGEARSDSGLPQGNTTTTQTTTNVGTGYDTARGGTDDAMTRSEERLRVGTEKVEAGRARLRKYVVTENVTQTVPVTREEVRLEREPITDANVDDALSGPEISEAEHEIVLHEERPVIAKETVPVERVRLSKDQITDEQTVSEDVRKEQIDTEGAYQTESRRGR